MVSKKGAPSSSSNHDFQVGDIVLAKIKGFPAWPGILVGPNQTPQEVLREKPKDKFVIRFFPKADYHFPGKKDLTLLTREDCRAYAEDSHRKDGELKAAYKIGANPDEWLEETDRIVQEAEKARVQEELEAQENEDQLQDEEANGGDEQSFTTAKKRSAGDAGSKASASKAKKAKTEKKSGSTVPRKSAGVADDDAADVSGAGENDDPMKKVRNWRHSLQRAFLPKDREPTAQDLEPQGDMFTTVEKADITADQLRETKINKVMRKIIGLERIPLDEIHHFRERAEALISKWNVILNGSAGGSEATPKTGGAPAEASQAEPKKEETESSAPATSNETSAQQPNGNSEPINGTSTALPVPTSESKTSAIESKPAVGDETVGDLTEIKDDA